jgi:hypothetical protein
MLSAQPANKGLEVVGRTAVDLLSQVIDVLCFERRSAYLHASYLQS